MQLLKRYIYVTKHITNIVYLYIDSVWMYCDGFTVVTFQYCNIIAVLPLNLQANHNYIISKVKKISRPINKRRSETDQKFEMHANKLSRIYVVLIHVPCCLFKTFWASKEHLHKFLFFFEVL